MKYDHIVKVGEIYYQAGEEVPETNDKQTEGNNIPLPSESVNKRNSDEYSDSDIVLETPTKPYYTEQDLDNMTVKQIKQVAEEMGISITNTARKDVVNEFLEKQG